jgi:hypothetical protein
MMDANQPNQAKADADQKEMLAKIDANMRAMLEDMKAMQE